MAQMTEASKRLGRRIREARHARQLTLEQVAALTGRNAGQISRIERGRIPHLPVSTLWNIAKALGVKPGALLNDRAA